MSKLFTGAASFELLRSDLPYIYIGLPMLALFAATRSTRRSPPAGGYWLRDWWGYFSSASR